MLERSLTAMILAVLPVSLGRFELPPHLVWGAPAVLFAVAAPYLHIAPIRRMRRDPSYQPGLAYRLALVIEPSVAATMFLRVASSLMAIHEPPAA